MTKAVWCAAAAAAVLFVASPVFAQAATDTKTLNVSATVSARAKLTLSSASVSFADADPDVTPSIVATPLTVDVKTRTAAREQRHVDGAGRRGPHVGIGCDCHQQSDVDGERCGCLGGNDEQDDARCRSARGPDRAITRG